MTPIVDCAPAYLAVEKGIFKKYNLDVKLHESAGGAAMIPAIVSGDQQFGFSNAVSNLLAASEGLPLRAVATAVGGGETEETAYPGGILVSADSPIQTPMDLEGKTIAVNTLNNIVELTIKASLEKEGVDVSTLKFIEIPFPDMPVALDEGRVEVVTTVEPFLTSAQEQGARLIINPFFGTSPGLQISQYVTSMSYLNERPDAARRFAKAIAEANAYAQEHPEEIRKLIPEYTALTPDMAQNIDLPTWSQSIDKQDLTLINELAQKYRLYDEPVDIDELVATP